MKATHKDWVYFNGRIVNTKEEQPMIPLEREAFNLVMVYTRYSDLYDGKPHLLDLHFGTILSFYGRNKINSTVY